MSKVIRDCIVFVLLRSVIAKRKSIVTCSPPNSCAFTLTSFWVLIISIFLHIDCSDYMVLDFWKQLKTALKDREMSWGSKWERGKVGLGGYAPLLLGFNIGSFKKDIIPAFTFSTFCRLSLNMWLHTLVMIRGLMGGTHDKVEGHVKIQMEEWGKYS